MTRESERFNRGEAYTDTCPICGEEIFHGDIKHVCTEKEH